MSDVAIFWDYENCIPPSGSCGLGYDIVNNISRIARLFGSVTTFRAYLDVSAQSPKSVALRSELQSSGLSIIDCPHNGRKDVVDKMVLVDMLAFAVDHSAPATIILIAGDRDYAYAVSTLKLRKYQVILVVPSSPHTSPSLESQASLVIDWPLAALRTRTESGNAPQAVRQPSPELDANLMTSLLKELHVAPFDEPDATTHPAASESSPMVRRISARDLLEPSRHYKNTGSLGLSQEFTATASTSDPAPGELLVPKTPSRSRDASVSTGSTRARSSTIAGQSAPAVEQYTPPRALLPSIARGPDAMDFAGPAKRSPPALSSLDTFELPHHDSCPPSSIIVRSPLEPSRPAPDAAKPSTPSYRHLNGLASPFVMSRTTAALTAKTSHVTPSPTPAKTSKIKDPDDPEEIERVSRLLFDDNDSDSDTDSVQSFPHTQPSTDGTRDATDTPKSNYHTCLTPPSTYSPSSTNVGVHLADPLPSCKHASSPAPIPPEVPDPFAAFSRASNALARSTPSPESLPSSSAFPSSPFTVPPSADRDEPWTKFQPLVRLLLEARKRGIIRQSRSTIALELVQEDKLVYQRVGVSKFRDYAAQAEQAGVIELGGREGGAWIALHPNWFGVATSGTSSPASDPPQVIQSPLFSGPKTPLMERATMFRSPSFQFGSLNTPPPPPRAFIPTEFQPLINVLVRMRDDGFHQPLRSVLGGLLDRDVYARAGVSRFREYVHQASEAQLVQLGGVGGHEWVCLHPELQI